MTAGKRLHLPSELMHTAHCCPQQAACWNSYSCILLGHRPCLLISAKPLQGHWEVELDEAGQFLVANKGLFLEACTSVVHTVRCCAHELQGFGGRDGGSEIQSGVSSPTVSPIVQMFLSLTSWGGQIPTLVRHHNVFDPRNISL